MMAQHAVLQFTRHQKTQHKNLRLGNNNNKNNNLNNNLNNNNTNS